MCVPVVSENMRLSWPSFPSFIIMSTMSKPKHWPEGVPYLRVPLHDKSLTATQLQQLRVQPSASSDIATMASSNHPRTPNPLVRIQPITQATHPACGQHGLFAARDLPGGSFVVPYLGRTHAGETDQKESDYDLWLERGLDVAVDAAREGNEGRYVNDYRGVRERANAEFRTVWCERFGELCVGVWVVGGKKGKGGIRKGEEICVSYGKGFWEERKVEGGEEEEKGDIGEEA